MNTPSLAYRQKPMTAPTGRSVPAASPLANYVSKSAWRIDGAQPSNPAPHGQAPGRFGEPPEDADVKPSNILLLHPDLLGPDDLEMLGRLGELGLQVPVTALLGGDAVEISDETSRKHLVDRLNAIAELLKTDQTAPATTNGKVIERGNLRLDFKTCQAFWRNQSVSLTITEFNIVSLFAARMGENLSYREIYDVVHGVGFCAGDGATGYQTNVRSLIKRIRQKFSAIDSAFEEIDNHRGYGYRWRECQAIAYGETTAPESAIPAGVLMVCLVNAPAG